VRIFFVVLLLVSACSQDKGGSRDGSAIHDGGVRPADLSFDRDAFFVQDPPVMYCGLDGGGFATPPIPGGTLACPDDKNLPGCPCPAEGMTAKCWTGARANRNLGICKDGTTTCTLSGEVALDWGPCEGEVLPDPGATEGARACKCFSAGQWKLDNLVPCFANAGGTLSAYSATPATSAGGQPSCDKPQPAMATWSTNTVLADCAGHFTLCYAIKAGDYANPQPGDCTIAKVCTTGDYTQVGAVQPFPSLLSWSSNDSACVQKLTMSAYGEMSVNGETVTCDQLPDHVFNRIQYCKPNDSNCSSNGSGMFP
jgi:hypothetical protein